MLSLTLPHTLRYPTEIVIKYGLTLLIAGTISACNEKSSDQNSLQDRQLKPQVETQDELGAIVPEGAGEPINLEPDDNLETLLLDSSHYQDDTLDEMESRPKDNKSIVQDVGFSGTEQRRENASETSVPERFCLNSGLNRQNAHSSTELVKDACRQISKRLASVEYSACEAAKLQLTGCSSVNGFPILVSEFAPLKTRKPQGRILIVGGTHGDELTSVSVTMRWIEKLNRHHSGLFHWHLAPLMNPDGVLKSGATRTNGNGVDLNRNMPSNDWQRNALKYWVEKSSEDPRKYPGETASSEPETQWLIDEINSFKPDAIISVHAPYGVVDFDSLLLNAAPKNLGKLHLNLLGTYPGSLGNYAGINRDIPVITLELPHSWIMPSEADSTKIWEDIVSWLKKNVNTNGAKSD
jgi:hypothetical protein